MLAGGDQATLADAVYKRTHLRELGVSLAQFQAHLQAHTGPHNGLVGAGLVTAVRQSQTSPPGMGVTSKTEPQSPQLPNLPSLRATVTPPAGEPELAALTDWAAQLAIAVVNYPNGATASLLGSNRGLAYLGTEVAAKLLDTDNGRAIRVLGAGQQTLLEIPVASALAAPDVPAVAAPTTFPMDVDPRRMLPASWGQTATLTASVDTSDPQDLVGTAYLPPQPGDEGIGRLRMTALKLGQHIEEGQTIAGAGLDPARFGLGIVAFAQRPASGDFDVAVVHVDGVAVEHMALTPDQSREVGRQLVAEIELLRAHGLQPTDLKPEHVLVRQRADGSIDGVSLIDPYLFDVKYAQAWTARSVPFIAALLDGRWRGAE